MNSTAGMRPVKKENDDDDDVLCAEVKQEYMMDAEQIDTSTDSDKTNPSNMQQNVSTVADDDDDWVTKIDHQYKKLLDSFREDGTSDLSDNPLRSIRYEVDNGTYDKREFKAAVTNKRSREDRNTTIRVAKKSVESKPRVQANTKKTTTKEAGFGLRQRQSLGSEKSVKAHVKRNSQHNGDASEKEDLEDHMVLDESYRSYLKWLVENLKSSRTTLEKEIRVKCEEDYPMSLSDSDSDVVVIGDRPFMDEEDSPFVPSKNYKVIVSITFVHLCFCFKHIPLFFSKFLIFLTLSFVGMF